MTPSRIKDKDKGTDKRASYVNSNRTFVYNARHRAAQGFSKRQHEGGIMRAI